MAAPPPVPGLQALLKKNGDIILAMGVFGILAVLVVPLPPLILDLLLAISITLSMLIFLVSLYVKKPVEFSSFPIVLLISTIFRLALNVASTRLILLHGGEGTDAAGHVIQAFGNFVVGGNYVVGFILFCILLVINFMVVTKGAGRVAEVAARFTLDAMPGKQMAIDAELNAGLIDDKGAKRRRAEVAQEADFYGAMDGASKFIKGDAIAAILIMVINIVAGVVIGVGMGGLDLTTALANYTVLTIGDGLASQVPALIVSAAAGLLVTRVSDLSDETLDAQFSSQLLGNPRVIAVLAAMAGGFVLIPGLRVPFSALSIALGVMAWQIRAKPVPVAAPTRSTAPPVETRPEDALRVEPLVVEVALDLVSLVDDRNGGPLAERIQRLRKQLAGELGVLVPPVHLRDNVRLQSGKYRVLLRGEAIGTGKLVPKLSLALDPGTASGTLAGQPGVDPVFGLKGWWIADNLRLRAQSQGYTVVDGPTVFTTHLDDLLRRHAHEIYGRQQLADALERVSQDNPRLVEELIPDPLPRTVVLKVFRNLIQEGVGVRDVQAALEALAEYAPRVRDPEVLTEFVRQRLARSVTSRFAADDGVLSYVALGAELEDLVLRGLNGGENGAVSLVLDPDTLRRIILGLRKAVDAWQGEGELVLLVPPLARGPLHRAVERALPRVPILSPAEISPGTQLSRVGELSEEKKGLKAVAQ